MVLPLSQIKNLPVFTKSGTKLGVVMDLEVETDSQSILRYLVQRGRVLGRWQEPLIIHRNQVIYLTAEKIVVDDNAGENKESKKERQTLYEPTAANS